MELDLRTIMIIGFSIASAVCMSDGDLIGGIGCMVIVAVFQEMN